MERRSDTHAELMAKWAETKRTGMTCTCQSHYTDARQCKRHGAMLLAKGTKS